MNYFKRSKWACVATLCAGFAGVGETAQAAACVAGNLQSYTALSSGCTIGAVQFANFQTEPASFTELSPANVLLTPNGNAGFLVGLNVAATAGQTFQTTFSFVASGATFLTGTVGLIGSSVDADGANTGTGIFTPGGNAIAFDLGGGVSQLSESVSLGGASSILTQLDFVIDGGQSGTASLQQGSVLFSAQNPIPEPSTIVLSLSVLLGLAWNRRKELRVIRGEDQ